MAKTVLSGVVLALVLALAGPATAQDNMTGSVGLDVVSDYIWRGQALNEHGALQPWGQVGYGDFGLKVWGSMDLDDQPNDAQWKFTELELIGSYDIPIGESYGVKVGGIYYSFPNTDTKSTIELFGTFTYKGLKLGGGDLAPFVSLYYDVDEIKGFYLQGGATYGQKLQTFNWEVALALGAASADYNDGYFGVDDFALNDLTATFRVEFPFTTNFSVTAFVSGSWMMDSDIKNAVKDDSNYAFGGGVSYTF
jgi:hypothetical protein